MNTIINMQEVELDIEYEISGYDDLGDYFTPPSSEYIIIIDVLHKGESIYNLVTNLIPVIEELTAEKL